MNPLLAIAIVVVLIAFMLRDKKHKCNHKFTIESVVDFSKEPKCVFCDKTMHQIQIEEGKNEPIKTV